MRKTIFYNRSTFIYYLPDVKLLHTSNNKYTLDTKLATSTNSPFSHVYLYGLGAMGKAGVTKYLEIIPNALELNIILCGLTDIDQVDRTIFISNFLHYHTTNYKNTIYFQ